MWSLLAPKEQQEKTSILYLQWTAVNLPTVPNETDPKQQSLMGNEDRTVETQAAQINMAA